MFFLPVLFAAGSLPLISGAPVASNLLSAETESTHSLHGRSSLLYAGLFGGDGLLSQGWPSIENWITSFDDMWDNNLDVLRSSCKQFGFENNSDDEIAGIKKAIKQVSSESGIDARYIMSIMMQESNGCVRVKTTNYGVNNPGLMQSHNGKGTCNDGNPISPCTDDVILTMIRDGTTGTAGLQDCKLQVGGDTDDATAYYKAARCYNSGSIASSGNLGQGIATHCYASDIANRLLGWATGPSHCQENDIGSLSTSNWNGESDSGSGSGSSGSSGTTSTSSIPAATETFAPSTIVPVATQTAQPQPEPTTTETSAPAAPTTTPAPTAAATPVPTAAPSSAPAPSSAASDSGFYGKYPYASASCQQYYTVQSNDYCRKIEVQYGIDASTFQSLNPGLDNTCSNLWKGYEYCVKA
ncbi:hypothetical protein N7532_007578 [Penicillium argentinense]|uniref:LysM domain-containing protein n=1 Tax=Penicillium argentinense TaxID=1131581 RepID=A0A9W9F888_9EURO|nr:uncharacterized protein N7532_007578 [Penicillium argentinense]KAJ5095287.1 hypothetical protein N7532_007578 [Penicillium argentinense]